jgi:hypothetical protein
MNIEVKERSLTTADLAAATEMPAVQREIDRDVKQPAATTKAGDADCKNEQLAPLFLADVAKDFRARWDAVQGSFVDDPKQAVRQGDELVAQVMKSLAETFSNERTKLEGQLDQTDNASTENLRVALRRYRSFFQRLLSL